MNKSEVSGLSGWLSQDENGYHFWYDPAYLSSEHPIAVSPDTTFKGTSLHQFGFVFIF